MQHMENPILVPMNFSNQSEAALQFAVCMAKSTERPLLILHVVHEPGGSPGLYRRNQDLDLARPARDIAERMLKQRLAAFTAEHQDFSVLSQSRIMLVEGVPQTRIAEVAEKIDASVIVIGSNARSPLARFLSGSISEHVVKKSRVPVMVVRMDGEAYPGFLPTQSIRMGQPLVSGTG